GPRPWRSAHVARCRRARPGVGGGQPAPPPLGAAARAALAGGSGQGLGPGQGTGRAGRVRPGPAVGWYGPQAPGPPYRCPGAVPHPVGAPASGVLGPPGAIARGGRAAGVAGSGSAFGANLGPRTATPGSPQGTSPGVARPGAGDRGVRPAPRGAGGRAR